jgi:energy-coupling factor transporter ATPase
MLFEVKDVSYTYMRGTPFATEVLKDCTFALPAGRISALIGASQSGKSTLVLLLLGLLKPQRGSVLFQGQDIHRAGFDVEAMRMRVGLVFQTPEWQLFEDIVGKDVSLGPRRKKLPLAESRRLVREALEAVGLPYEEFRTRYIYALSGGQKRRVAIAGVLAMEPEAILFDEPTAGLDPRGRQELLTLIRRLKEERQLSIVLTSSSLADVAGLADHVVVLHAGRAVMSGSVREILAQAGQLRELDITLPPATQIALALQEVLPALRTDLLTLDELEEELLRLCPPPLQSRSQPESELRNV